MNHPEKYLIVFLALASNGPRGSTGIDDHH
jgi:hypothetical protein